MLISNQERLRKNLREGSNFIPPVIFFSKMAKCQNNQKTLALGHESGTNGNKIRRNVCLEMSFSTNFLKFLPKWP